ncbi:MAG TPA: phosphatase PAP2 family protein [Actinomycetota bacterium]
MRRTHEHPLLMNRRLDVVTAAVLLALGTILLALMAFGETREILQGIDDAAARWFVSVRWVPLTGLAHLLNLLGSVWVTLPVRIAAGAYLAITRRWWHLLAFASAMLLSEASVSILKALYDRPRPVGSLVETSGASFPSGHAVAASVTTVALVIALFPPAGLHRWLWGAAAAVFAFAMALSRAYLAAHWLSDAVTGTFLGVSIALVTALIVEWIRGPDVAEEPARETVPRGPGTG